MIINYYKLVENLKKYVLIKKVEIINIISLN